MFSVKKYPPHLQTALFDYLLRMADTSLVLGHRLSEWSGHGPVLEQDIALSNIALDLIGQARSWYQLAAMVEDKGRDEDDLAYLRDVLDYRNLLLAEQPNGDFGHTVMRQFLFDVYHFYLLKKMLHSTDENIAAIAEKSLKEVSYHLKWSSEWVIRLGDGTGESKKRIQDALDTLWPFSGELTTPNPTDKTLEAEGLAPALETIRPLWHGQVQEVLGEATLIRPGAGVWMQKGGKDGLHTEHLGYLLAEMQFLQRAYPNNEW